MKSASQQGSVRERILETAFDLFYRQGYRTTGINQLIADSGVAKASFYDHFPSKEVLLLAYAQEQARREFEELRLVVESKQDPMEQFLAALNTLHPWLEATHFRGCPFQNLMVEVPPEATEVRKIGELHRENLRGLFRLVTLNLKSSDRRFGNVNVDAIADAYLLLFDGAIAAAVAYQTTWPVDHAIKTMQQLIEAMADNPTLNTPA